MVRYLFTLSIYITVMISRFAAKSTEPKLVSKQRTGLNQVHNTNTKSAKRARSTLQPTDMDLNDPWKTTGNGQVNERRRGAQHQPVLSSLPSDRLGIPTGFQPLYHKSHLWHALEGLDRYPNYLSRWNDEQDIIRLEEALQKQLQLVQTQKEAIIQKRRKLEQLRHDFLQQMDDLESKSYNELLEYMHDNHPGSDQSNSPLRLPTWDFIKKRILHPEAAKVMFGSRMFKNNLTVPSVADVLSGKSTVELDPALLEVVMEQECFDVYSIPILSPQFCTQLQNYAQDLAQFASRDEYEDLQLGQRPIDFEKDLGLTWMVDLLFHLIIRPISRHLFYNSEDIVNGELDWRQAYIAGYAASEKSSATPRTHLVAHTDDSEVTLNICLSQNFRGGNVEFYGLRGTKSEGKLQGTFVSSENQGVALLHSGRHLHSVSPVEEGNRFTLIVWSRSWQGCREHTCPCCWLNRRGDAGDFSDCICGKRWNS